MVVHDFVRHVKHPVGPHGLSVLAALDTWRSVREVESRTGLTAAEVKRLLAQLREHAFVEATGDRSDPVSGRLPSWEVWGPEATYFHYGTRDGTPRPATGDVAGDLLARSPRPESVKELNRRGAIRLRPYARRGSFVDVLMARRSWQRFGKTRVTVDEIGTLLGLTWGVQSWLALAPGVQAPLKTSPSGGACHSIEVYVLAHRVAGLKRGIYHYHPDEHVLQPVPTVIGRRPVARYLNGQQWADDCSALFFMTSVVRRTQWKYAFPRAYRVVLLEAGHLCQTFCLVATWMKLAPFCSAALTDSAIERALGIDGVNEVLVYAAGVGTRPRDLAEARWPAGAAAVLSAPRHMRGSRGRWPRD